MSILDFVPEGYTLRKEQESILTELRAAEDCKFVAIKGAVAIGKSLVANILADYYKSKGLSTAILTPQLILQDQYHRDFPLRAVLKGASHYPCHSLKQRTCAEFEDKYDYKCKGCTYTTALKEAKNAKIAIFNFHSYMANLRDPDTFKDILIIDEAHNLLSSMFEMFTLRLWKNKDPNITKIDSKDDLIIYLESELVELKKLSMELKKSKSNKELKEVRSKIMKYDDMIFGLQNSPDIFFIHRGRDKYRNKLDDFLEIQPLKLSNISKLLWPAKHVKKIIFMSATLSPILMERLGIAEPIHFIEGDSPIPKDSRPCIAWGRVALNYNNYEESVKILAQQLNELKEVHKGKGIIHTTYRLAEMFKPHLKDKRFVWHDKESKHEAYNTFLVSKDQVLIACGMSEGIDLVGEGFEWQAITKIQYPNLGEPINKYIANKYSSWYNWDTAQVILQQYGRICRTPTDKGITYILDGAFRRFYNQNSNLFPKYFKDAIKWKE